VSAKDVLLWSNDDGLHAAVEWQVAQSVGIPGECFGFADAAYWLEWQAEHCVGVPAYWPFL